MRLAIFLSAPTILLLASTAARADSSDPAAARAQLQQGYALKQLGRCEEALPHFEESVRLDRQPKALVNLADCEEKLGKLAAAQAHFVEARDLANGLEALRNVAEQHLTALDKKMPRLVLRVAKGAPPDTAVIRDGVKLGPISLNTPLPIDPGHHKILARSATMERQYDVSLSEGETRELEVSPAGGRLVADRPDSSTTPGPTNVTTTLAPPGSPPVARVPDDGTTNSRPSSLSAARTWTIIGEGTVAAAGLAVGVGYLLAANSAQNRLDEAQGRIDLVAGNCRAPMPAIQGDCSTLANDSDIPDKDRSRAAVGFVVGGISLAALMTTLLLWRSGDAPGSASIVPKLSSHEQSLTFRWRY